MRPNHSTSFGLTLCVVAIPTVFFAFSALAGTKMFVVPSTGPSAAAIDAGLRGGLATLPGITVADATATATLIEDGNQTGITCAADDGQCWLRLAVLGGFDHVVYVSGAAVTQAGAAGPQSSPALGTTEAHWKFALRRAFRLDGALRLKAPKGSTVKLDDVAAQPESVVEGLAAGAHVVTVTAPGFVARTLNIVVAAGAIDELVVTLDPSNDVVVPPEPSPASGLSPLFLTGGVVAGVGVLTALGGVVVAVGGELEALAVDEQEGGSEGCSSPERSADVAAACDQGQLGWLVTIAGVVVGGVGGALIGFSLSE